eukprot:5195739-Prymnesium_polylepis.1
MAGRGRDGGRDEAPHTMWRDGGLTERMRAGRCVCSNASQRSAGCSPPGDEVSTPPQHRTQVSAASS